MDVGSLKATFSIDTSPLDSGLKSAAKKLSAFRATYANATDVQLKAEYKQLVSGLKTASKSLDSFRREARRGATVEVNVDGVSETVSGIRQASKARSALDGTEATVEVGQRGAAQTTAVLSGVKKASDAVNGQNVTLKIDADGGAATVAQLGAVNAAANRVDGRRIELGFNPSLGGLIDRVNNGLQQTATRIRAFSTVGTAAALPILIAGIGGIVPVATAAATALGGLASAAGQGLAGGLGAGLSALSGFAGGLGLLYAAAFPTIKAFSDMETNSNALSTAQNGLKTATDGVATAEQSAMSAAQSLSDARLKTKQATEDLSRAQTDLNWAMEDEPTNQAYTALDLADARDRLGDATRQYNEDVAEYGRNSEEATDSARNLQRAELDLSQQTRDTARIQQNGSAQIVGAKDAEKSASEGVASAHRAEKQASAELSRANAEVSTALAAVAVAQADVSAKSKGLTASQQGLLGVWQKVSSFAGRVFKPANDDLNNLAASTLNYVSGALPALGGAAQASVGGFSSAIDRLKGSLGGGGQLALFNQFLGAIPRLLEQGTVAVGNFAGGFFNMLVAALPAANRFQDAMARIGTSFRSWTASSEGQTALTQFFNSASQKGAILVGVVRDLVLGIVGLGGAFDESGLSGWMLQGLANMAARFRNFTSAGSEGRAMLVSFSQAAQPTLDATWRLLGAIFTEWGRVAGALVRARDEAGKLVVPQALDGIRAALPVIGQLLTDTFVRFGPMIGPLVSGLAGLLNVFIAHNPVLQRLSGLVIGALTAFNNLSPTVKTVIASVVSAASVFSVLGIGLGSILSVAGFVSGAFATVGGAFTAVATALGVGLLPLVAGAVAVIGGLVVAGIAIYRNWDRIKGVFQPLIPIFNQVKSAVQNLFTVIKSLLTGDIGTKQFTEAWRALPGPIQNAILVIGRGLIRLKNAFSQAWTQIRPILTQIASGIRTGLGTAFNFLRGQAAQLVNFFRTNWPQIRAIVVPVLQTIGNILRTVLVGAFRFALQNIRIFVNFFRQNWPLIRQTTMTVFNAVRTIITTVFRAIIAVVRPIVMAMVALWRTNSQQILSIARSVWNIIKTVIQTAIRVVLGVIKATMQAINGDWRGAWQTIRGVLNTVWEAMKSIVRSALNIVKNIIQIAWNNIRGITNAAWNALKNLTNRAWDAIRDAVTSRIRKARENVETAVNNLKSIAMRVFESMPGPIQEIFRKIGGFIADPIGTAVGAVRGFLYDLIGMVNKVLDAVGLKKIDVIFGQGGGGAPPDAGGIGRRGLAKGGVTTDPNMGEAFAHGGVSGMRRARPERFARGGMGTPGPNPRMHMWNEQQGGEAFIAEKRPASEQLPYLQTAADWHGYAVVPSNPGKAIPKGYRDFAHGGLVPISEFAGGGIGAMYEAVKSKFGVSGFNNHGSYLSGEAAANSLDFAPGPLGVKATGSSKELGDNIAAFTAPPSAVNTIWYGSANFGSGWQPYSTGPGVGNAVTLGHYDHVHAQAHSDQFRGAQGNFTPGSGGGGGISVPNPMQILFEKMWGNLIKPLVNRVIEPMENSKNRIVNIAGAAGRRVPKGIYDWIDEKIPDTIGGTGTASGNFSGSKQDMALTFAKNAVSRGMPGRLPVMTSMQELGGYWFGNTDDYRSVTGYSSAADHDSLGFFQQRPSTGWGSPEQIMDPAYALGKFLDAAAPFKGRYSNDPGGLSAWAQAVQRSAYPDAYAKHWDAAGKVIGDPKYYEKGGRVPGREGEAKLLMAHAGEIVFPKGISDTLIRFLGGIEDFVKVGPLAKMRTALDGIDPESFRPPPVSGVGNEMRQYRTGDYPRAEMRSGMGDTSRLEGEVRAMREELSHLRSEGIKTHMTGMDDQPAEKLVSGTRSQIEQWTRTTAGDRGFSRMEQGRRQTERLGGK